MDEERVKYNTIRDDFSSYNVENGQILKVKLSVVDVINTMDGDKKKGSVSIIPYSHVVTTPNLRRYDMIYERGAATEQDQVKELKFTTVDEVINIYETKKLFIFAGLRVEKIFLTNKADDHDNPILRYQSTHGVSVSAKPNFENPQAADTPATE